MNKRCSHCKETKPPEEFYKNAAKKDGLDNNCKECRHFFSTGLRVKNQPNQLKTYGDRMFDYLDLDGSEY